MTIVQLLILAFIGEAVWETCKMFYQKGKVSIDRIGAALVGLLIAFGAQVDLFAMVGFTLVIPYLGYVLTGLLISRGANVVHDIWKTITGFMTGVVSRGDLSKKENDDKIIIPAKAHSGIKINIRPLRKVKESLIRTAKGVSNVTSNVVSSIRRPSGAGGVAPTMKIPDSVSAPTVSTPATPEIGSDEEPSIATDRESNAPEEPI